MKPKITILDNRPSSQRIEYENSKIKAAENLCRIYFEIASEAIGEEKVREIRDQKLKEVNGG
jgi:hypothetical protein